MRIGVGASTSRCGLNHLFGIGDLRAVTMTKEFKAAPPFTLPRSADEAAFRDKARGRCWVPRLIASNMFSWVFSKEVPASPFLPSPSRGLRRFLSLRRSVVAVGHAKQLVGPARLKHRKHHAQQVTRHAHNGLLLRPRIDLQAYQHLARAGRTDGQPPGGLDHRPAQQARVLLADVQFQAFLRTFAENRCTYPRMNWRCIDQ